MRDRKRQDPLLDHLRQLVRHLRLAALPRAQDLQPVTLDLALPRVVGRTMNPERPAGLSDVRAGGLAEQLQAIAEQHVILRHATPSELHWREARSVSRSPDGPENSRGLRCLTSTPNRNICRENTESVQIRPPKSKVRPRRRGARFANL